MGKVIEMSVKSRVKKNFERLKNVDAAMEAISMEAKLMLGLIGQEEDLTDYKPVAFDALWDIWDEANSHCYFCSDSVDPNEEEFGEIRGACPVCIKKLESFLRSGK